MHSILVNDLQIIIASLVFAALSAYNFFAFYEFSNHNKIDEINFIDNIILFSMFWIINSIFIVLTFLYRSVLINEYVFSIVFILSLVVAITMLIASINFIKNKKLKAFPFLPVAIIYILSSIFVVLFRVPIHLIFDITLYMYITASIIYVVFAFRFRKIKIQIGLIYNIGGIITILFVNILESLLGTYAVSTIYIALSVFLNVGFFLFYCELYFMDIKEKINNIEHKNHQLTTAKKQIQQLAFYDPITLLKNVYTLKEDLKSNQNGYNYVMIVNIENFKSYNNLIGYEKGNNILEEVASNLKSLLSVEEEIYRFYSDKFIILINNNEIYVLNLINRIISLFNTNLFSNVTLNPYIGVSQITRSKDFNTIIRELELTSQYVKKRRLSYCFYNDFFFDDFKYKLMLETDLRSAVIQKPWLLHLQPQISFKDNKIIGAEMLIRWKNNDTYISPEVFIPIAEELGLINEIGDSIIETAFSYLRQLNDLGYDKINISINLSPYQLMAKKFTENIMMKATKFSIKPENVTFEITESSLIHNIEKVNRIMSELQDMGFCFSLDDFGKGYSSLFHFTNLNLDEVKFDKTFTHSLPYNEKNLILLNSLTEMCRKLNVRIIIEGIENEEQYSCFKRMNCDYYQGYYFSKPISIDEFIDLLKQSN